MPEARDGIEFKMALNGRLFTDEDEWCLTFPSPGDSIVFTAVPHGGGDSGKDMLRMVAIVAIAIVATYYAGPEAGAAVTKAGYGAFAAGAAKFAATAAVMVVGGILVNALIPPPNMDLGALGDGSGGLDSSATYSWSTVHNRLNQGGAVGVLYGTLRVTPQLIAKYTSLVDEDDTEQGQQYLNLLFAVADHYTDFIGDLQINDQDESGFPDTHPEVRRGEDNQSAIDWFGVTYSETPIAVELDSDFKEVRKIYNYEYLKFGDDYYDFETSGACSSILIELNYVRGFGNYEVENYYSGDEWRTRLELKGPGEGIWDVRYRVRGTSTWSYTTFTVRGYRNRRFRCSAVVEFPSTDVFEVGIKMQNNVIEGATGNSFDAKLEAVTSFVFENPSVVHTTSTGIDRLVVSLVLPQGLYHIADDGELAEVSVQINVDVRRVGQSSWNSQIKKITAATSSTLRRYYYYDFDTPGQFQIRMYFASPPKTGTRYVSKVFFDHIKEGLWEGFSYPGTSTLALRALATEQLSGGMPRVSMLAQRNVLSVYDGNGWLDKPANNPAWVCWDMLTNERYGGNIDTNRILYNEFEQWADFCTANGFEVNAYFDTTISFPDALNRVSAIGHGTVMQKGTDFGVVIDQAGTATQLFTIGNIVADSFQVSYLGIEDRLNAIEVTYTDKDKGYTREVLEIRTHEFDTSDQVRKSSLDLSFITDREQAAKHGEYLLKNNLYLRKKVSFEADVDAIACMVGDVIKVQHDVPYWGQGGRVVSATADTVTIDQEVTREPGKTYAILVRHQDDDSLEEQNIESVGLESSDDTLPLVGAWSKIPAEDAVYSFGERTEVTEEFRLLAVNRSGDLRCTLECIEYNSAVYDNTFTIPEYEADPVVFLVKNLRADEFWRDQDGGGVGVMHLTWDGDAILFHVWYRLENTAHWYRAGETSNNKFDIHFLNPGKTYDFCVSGTLNPDDGVVVNKKFQGWGNKIRIVWPVTNLEIVGQGNNTVWQDRDLKLRWALQVSNAQTSAGNEPIGAGSFPPTTDLSKYRVQICNSDGSLRRELFTLQPEYIYTFEMNNEDTPSNALIIKVWAVDRFGHESLSPAVISVSNPAPAPPSGLRAEPFMRAVAFNWASSSEIDFDHYTYATKLNDEAWSDWEPTIAPALTRPLSDAEITATGGQALVHIKVRAHDTFGNISGEATTFAETMILTIESTDIEDFSITGSKMFNKIPILENDIWYANTPAAGQVSWNAHKLFYNGVENSIAAGSTAVSADDDALYIYWQQASPTAYQTSTTHPGDDGLLGEHDFIIAVNVNGAYNLAWNSVANQVVGSAYIMKAAINDLHVNEISASKIKALSIMTPGVYMGDALFGETTEGKVVTASVSAVGLYLTSTYLGFYNGVDWADSTYIKNDGKFSFYGDSNSYIRWDGVTLEIVGNVTIRNPSSVRTDINVEDGATDNASWRHSSDTTRIDGGMIYTDTITATQINGAGFGTLTLTSNSKIVISTTDGLDITGTGNIAVRAGCDIYMHAAFNNPSNIFWYYSDGSLIGRQYASSAGLYFFPGVSTTHNMYVGTTNVPFNNVEINASDHAYFRTWNDGGDRYGSVYVGDKTASLNARANASDYSYVRVDSDTLYGDIQLQCYGQNHRAIRLIDGNSISALFPSPDNTIDLGRSSYRYDDIYATNDTIITSDVRDKTDIEAATLGLDFVQRLNPIKFRWSDYTPTGDSKSKRNHPTITYKRKHYGFSAQQIEQVLADLGIPTNDFAGFIHDKETGRYGTRPAELMSVLWRAVQELSEQVNLLEERINA